MKKEEKKGNVKRVKNIKVQAYFSPRLVKKLDKECRRLQMTRADELRRLVDSLPD